MFKIVLAALVSLFAAAAFAATDVNKATQAELEAIKGVGPSIAGKILDERKKGAFKDWTDFIDRVKGIGEGNAAKFSADGLTVGNASFKGAAPAAKKDDKPADKPMAATPAAKPADKPVAAAVAVAAKSAEAKPAMKDDKPMSAKEAKAAKAKEAKDAKVAKADTKEAKKPEAAASAAKK